jgi:hypothetical protein
MTLVFKQSLTSAAKQIGCAANQALQITSAEMGAGTTIQVGSPNKYAKLFTAQRAKQ